MKSRFLFIAVAALAMASCSKDEQTAVNRGAAIDFRGAMATRATETTTANLDDIFVTALDKNNANFFTDEQFAKDVDNFLNPLPPIIGRTTTANSNSSPTRLRAVIWAVP